MSDPISQAHLIPGRTHIPFKTQMIAGMYSIDRWFTFMASNDWCRVFFLTQLADLL
jgi:hypothetical protein